VHFLRFLAKICKNLQKKLEKCALFKQKIKDNQSCQGTFYFWAAFWVVFT